MNNVLANVRGSKNLYKQAKKKKKKRESNAFNAS